MAAAGVGQEIGQQIAAGLGPLDQMMMRIDDGQIGLDDFLVAAFEPLRPDCQMHTSGKNLTFGTLAEWPKLAETQRNSGLFTVPSVVFLPLVAVGGVALSIVTLAC
jgi:hypothetical protein